jgi:hypothetical protein
MPTNTSTTGALYDATRIRLLTFQPTTGLTLAERLAGGLSLVTPPDDAPTPYGAIRFTDTRHRRSQRGRLTAEVEALWVHRPRSKTRELEGIADTADEALFQWESASNGLIVCTAFRRQTLPPFREASDPELVQIRTLYDLVIYPAFLTQYLTPA